MATYVELHDLIGSPTLADLRKRVRVAVLVKAQAIAASQSPTAALKAWAIKALQSPDNEAETVLRYVLAANNAATVAGIQGATDTAVQTAVNAAVDTLLGA